MDTITNPEAPGLTAIIYQDEGIESPRDDECNLSIIACRDDHPHYNFGDADHTLNHVAVSDWAAEHDIEWEGWKTVRAYLVAEEGAIESTMVGLAITDHSGLYLRVGVADGSNGGDPWDTAFIGWAFATADTLREAGHTDPESLDPAQVIVWVKAEAREYGYWLAGEVYGVRVEDENGETLDSLGGYIGYDAVAEEAQSMLAAEHEARVADDAQRTVIHAFDGYLGTVGLGRPFTDRRVVGGFATSGRQVLTTNADDELDSVGLAALVQGF